MRDKIGDIDQDANYIHSTLYAFKEKIEVDNHHQEIQIIVPKFYITNIGQLKRARFYDVYENTKGGCIVRWGKLRSKSINME